MSIFGTYKIKNWPIFFRQSFLAFFAITLMQFCNMSAAFGAPLPVTSSASGHVSAGIGYSNSSTDSNIVGSSARVNMQISGPSETPCHEYEYANGPFNNPTGCLEYWDTGHGSVNAQAMPQAGFVRVAGSASGYKGRAGGSAIIQDYVTFDLPDGIGSAVVEMGMIVGGSASGSGCGASFWGFSTGSGQSCATHVGTIFSADVTVYDQQPFSFSASVFVDSKPVEYGAIENFLITGQVYFSLPQDVTYTSQVGAIYATSIVPIPAAVWLFGSALAGLGWMRRKQTL